MSWYVFFLYASQCDFEGGSEAFPRRERLIVFLLLQRIAHLDSTALGTGVTRCLIRHGTGEVDELLAHATKTEIHG